MDNLQKSLTELIDETLAEIEALKKSERYSAHEIDLADDKANGSMDTKSIAKADEDEDKEEEKEESDEAKKSDDEDEDDEEDEDEEAEMKKAEEACAKALKKYEMAKADAEHKKKMLAMKKGEWDKKEDKKEDDKDEDKDLKKSIDARVAPIESKLSEVLSAVKKLSDTPVPARGASYRDVKPLAKSIEVETLSKAQVLNEMISLKKSGKEVLSEDVIQVEDGSADHLTMARKYGIKA